MMMLSHLPSEDEGGRARVSLMLTSLGAMSMEAASMETAAAATMSDFHESCRLPCAGREQST